VAKVNTKYEGWIEKLYVTETGQKVKRGQPLFAVYSPELVASQREYVQVVEADLSGPHAEHLKKAARGRLEQFDVGKALVDRIASSGKAQRWTVFTSPANGYVTHKTAWQGSYVAKGANLFTIADLDALWVMADVYEYDAQWLEKGQRATVVLDYLRGKVFDTTVDYVYPTLDEHSRTLQVRLKLDNPDVVLKPGMFATVRIYTRPVEDALLVPPSAVIHSGERDIVFVAKGDGRFEARDLELGARGETAYQVLGGVEQGELVVVSGQFLLDSESQLKEAVEKMLGSNVGETAPSASAAASGEPAPPPSASAATSAHPKGH
jgi:Cu(I)/Ag(I) efflux system membrane fusion protein/cobalt-zinc-cadmium efflux system membrane fusion protein